jgi:hypothetical protein
MLLWRVRVAPLITCGFWITYVDLLDQTLIPVTNLSYHKHKITIAHSQLQHCLITLQWLRLRTASVDCFLRTDSSGWWLSEHWLTANSGLIPELTTTDLWTKLKSKSCYDRRSVGQCVLEWSTHLGLTTRFLLLSDNCWFVDVGRSLWREDGSVVYNCSRPLPVQTFSGPTPLVLVTIIYCLRFETSLFVASYELAGLRWRYSTPPPHGSGSRASSLLYSLFADRIWNTLYHGYNSVVVTQHSQLLFVVGEKCLATPLSREQSYMRAPISRLSGGTSHYIQYN